MSISPAIFPLVFKCKMLGRGETKENFFFLDKAVGKKKGEILTKLNKKPRIIH